MLIEPFVVLWANCVFVNKMLIDKKYLDDNKVQLTFTILNNKTKKNNFGCFCENQN